MIPWHLLYLKSKFVDYVLILMMSRYSVGFPNTFYLRELMALVAMS